MIYILEMVIIDKYVLRTLFQNYLDNYIKFNKNKELLNKIPYSDDQLDLFENKYPKKIYFIMNKII